MKTLIFIIINFIVGFCSDIVLNITGFVPSLNIYFANKTMLESAIYAGLTIIFALFITMVFSQILFGFTVPTTNAELVNYSALAFALGYYLDICIYNMKIFGNSLNMYYKILGAGFWGALAFLFSILFSYFMQNKILPIIYDYGY